MTKSRSIFLTVFGIGLLVAGAVMLVIGLRTALQPDVTCADVVMQVGDQCRNHASRGGGWYLLDYYGQRRNIHENGLQFVATGVVALFAGVGFVFGVRSGSRLTTPSPQTTPKPKTKFVFYYAFPLLVSTIYPVGMFLLSDAGWPILLMIPACAAALPFLVKYGERKSRGSVKSAQPGDQLASGPSPEPRAVGTPTNATRVPAYGILMAVMLVAMALYGLALLASLMVLPGDAALCTFQVVRFGETCQGHDLGAQKLANLRTGALLVVFCSLMFAGGWALIAYLRRSAARSSPAAPHDRPPLPYR